MNDRSDDTGRAATTAVETAMTAGRRWPAFLAALALGGLHAAAFSPPLAEWWVQLLSLSAMVALAMPGARVPRPGRAFGLAFAFGIGSFATGVGWLHTSMHVYGGMPSALAVAAVLLFAAYLALFPGAALAAACVVLRSASPRSPPPLAAGLAVGGAWGLSEMLRGWAFTGFPWLSIGYAHVDGPLAGLAPWLGVYGIGAVAAAIAATLGTAASRAVAGRASRQRGGTGIAAPQGSGARRAAAVPMLRAAAPALGCAAFLGAAGLLGRVEPTRQAGDPVTVRLVQGNVPQQMKFDRLRTLQAMEDYTAFVETSKARLTVLPETAWTVPWEYTPGPIATRLQAHDGARKAVAIGMPLSEPAGSGQPSPRYTNSVALIAPGRRDDVRDARDVRPQPPAARYDKRHLVPFGEFVPPGFRWFVDLMRIPLGDFGRGAQLQAPFEIAGQRFAFNVCYEDLFGEELLPAIRMPHGATVLVNVSNIAWFGDSRALPQHLAIARMRTLETGRPMLRATNTGVTAAIDHRGRVLDALPAYTKAALDVSVRGTEGLTFYARTGNAGAGALSALMLAAAIAVGRNRRKR